MLQLWIDDASGDIGEKAWLGLFVMIAGAALAVVGGVLGMIRAMREEPA